MVENNKSVVVYQTKNGAIELQADFSGQTFWVTQAQIAEIFGTTPQNITLHLKNIFRENELSERATCKDSLQVRIEGGRKVARNQKFYNLDAVISVGYRVSSVSGTKFRQWATKVLKSHIVDGFTMNKVRLQKNYHLFLKSIDEVQKLLPSGAKVDAGSALELVKMFANTWLSLNAYDTSVFPTKGVTKMQVVITAQELYEALKDLKKELFEKEEATELFGTERKAGNVEGILGNVFQTFQGKDVYPTVESKAAHFFYFMVKNHPFVDGNKRSGAFAFVWLLKKAKLLNPARLSPEALTALTLLVAESKPHEKDRMIGIILLLLKK